MKFKLDFSIPTSEERMEAVKKILEENKNSHITQLELDTISNYILYGKDKDTGTSVVDRKEVQIKTKFNSYHKEKFCSLDELMESPTFNEADLNEDKSLYKKIKPSIDKEKAAKIPEMKTLWEEIERQQNLLDQNTGKKPFDGTVPKLGQKEIYFLKHHLIQLRTHQYYLMDTYYPTIGTQKHTVGKFYRDPLSEQMRYPVLPRGTAKVENDFEFINPFYSTDTLPACSWSDDEVQLWEDRGKAYFDFRNKDHLYYLVKYWKELKGMIEDENQAPLWELLWTFEIYQNLTPLSEQQIIILEGKKGGKSNKEIQAELQEKLGIFHQVNYISTIYLKLINKIIESVELNFDEWLAKDYKKAWKKCNTCGKYYLRDPRNFVRKTKSLDGLMGRCKNCDKLKRKGAPIVKWDVLPPKEKESSMGVIRYERS